VKSLIMISILMIFVSGWTYPPGWRDEVKVTGLMVIVQLLLTILMSSIVHSERPVRSRLTAMIPCMVVPPTPE